MKEVLISLFSGIIGAILTIGYQHFFSSPQSFTFIYNGDEIVVSESTYSELVKENEMLKKELSSIREQNDYAEQTDEQLAPPNIDASQETRYSFLLTDLDYFSKSSRVYTNSKYDNIDNHDTVYGSCITGKDEDSYIEYYIGCEYTNFSGTLYVTDHARSINPNFQNWDIATISIYGDGLLLYSYTGFSTKDKPLNIDIDITNVEFLKISFDNAYYFNSGLRLALICMGNPTISVQ